MKLLYSNKAICGKFPERQFLLGDHIVVRTGKDYNQAYFKGLRVVKIINERIFEVQDQITGSVYETDTEEMFLDATRLPVRPSSAE